jgi:hypothetical protein
MPRRFLGRIVEQLPAAQDVSVDWFYVPATFADSALAANAVHPLVADPVSAFFNGAIRSPALPVGLIVGLGLEPHRALGLMEFLEPSRVWALLGQSDEPRFAAEALKVNQEVVNMSTTTLLPYPVTSLAKTFSSLESLVFATQETYRLVLAPSGPKLFGLAALLVSAVAGELRPAVWRVGGQGEGAPMDVEEAGVVVGSSTRWRQE